MEKRTKLTFLDYGSELDNLLNDLNSTENEAISPMAIDAPTFPHGKNIHYFTNEQNMELRRMMSGSADDIFGFISYHQYNLYKLIEGIPFSFPTLKKQEILYPSCLSEELIYKCIRLLYPAIR